MTDAPRNIANLRASILAAAGHDECEHVEVAVEQNGDLVQVTCHTHDAEVTYKASR